MLKVYRNLKPFTGLVVLIIVFLGAQSVADLYLPTLMSDVVNNGMMNGDIPYIWKFGFYMLLVALGSCICSVAVGYLSSKTAVGLGRDLREKIFTHVEGYSLSEIDKIGTASLITRTTNDITQVQVFSVMMFRFIIYSPIMCVGGIFMALSKDTKLTGLLAIILPAMIIVMLVIAKFIIPMFKALQKKVDKVNLVLRENLTGIRVIRAFNRMKKERVRFDDANRDLTQVAIRVNKITAAVQPVMMLFMNGTLLAIVWFGGLRISNGDMNIGNMMAFLQYAMQIMFSIIMVAIMFIMMPRAQASANRINEVFDVKPEIKDPDQAAEKTGLKGYVEFKDVTFYYPGAKLPALQNISFAASPGEVTAIIGGTGSGKSTLINLIPRFYDVTEGQILVDGVDLRELEQGAVRKKIGFVPQTAILFSGTVAENIRYGKEDATDDEVTHAAEVAQAMEFISSMPEAFDSHISQGGTNVSGGQKQRLSIARALISNPEIYIFDDSFSALDFKTDANLRAALRKETAESTVIIVAQRVSTIMDADRIIVLDEGRIVGMGTHKELLKTNKVYYEIVASQLSEEEIA